MENEKINLENQKPSLSESSKGIERLVVGTIGMFGGALIDMSVGGNGYYGALGGSITCILVNEYKDYTSYYCREFVKKVFDNTNTKYTK